MSAFSRKHLSEVIFVQNRVNFRWVYWSGVLGKAPSERIEAQSQDGVDAISSTLLQPKMNTV